MIKLTKLLFAILLISSFAFSCNDDDDPDGTAACLQTKIDEFKSDQNNCDGASIKTYIFQEILLYAFASGNCISDGAIEIVKEDCDEYCLLGTIAGVTDCNGEDFFAIAVEQEVIWEN